MNDERSAHVVAMVPNTVSDADIAAGVRDEARLILETYCKLQARAAASGMRIEFQVGVDMYGRHTIHSLNILKVF